MSMFSMVTIKPSILRFYFVAFKGVKLHHYPVSTEFWSDFVIFPMISDVSVFQIHIITCLFAFAFKIVMNL